MNVPKLRFKEFDGEWEEKKLKDLSLIRTGKAFSSADFMKDGEFLVVTNKNILDQELKVESVGDRINITDKKVLEKYMLNDDNILVTMDGVKIGTTGKFRDDKAVLAQRVGRINSKEIDFIYQITKNEKFKNEMNKISVGNAIKHISLGQISNYTFFAPVSAEEQRKIGHLFSCLDQRIQMHKSKIDLLQEQKKGYMQKVFKQKINFGSDDIWQTKKVSEVATLLNGRAYKKEELLAEGKYRVLRVGNFFTNDSWYYSNLELENDKYANKGDLLYAWSASFGPQIWDDEKIIYHYHIWKVVPNEKMIERDFLYHWFDFDKERILSQKNGTTMVHITKGGLEKTDIQLPSLEQQQRISNFFNKLDERINLNKVYLKALQKQKQGFMQQMFI